MRKWTSVLLALCLMLSISAVHAVAAQNAQPISDVKDDYDFVIHINADRGGAKRKATTDPQSASISQVTTDLKEKKQQFRQQYPRPGQVRGRK